MSIHMSMDVNNLPGSKSTAASRSSREREKLMVLGGGLGRQPCRQGF